MEKGSSTETACCIKSKHRCMQTNDETECVRIGGYPVNSCSKCR